jgi:hypothetical protein
MWRGVRVIHDKEKNMARMELTKPYRKHRAKVQMYHGESMQIDSTSTVMDACGGCHSMGSVHRHDRTSVEGGVGYNGPFLSGNATVTSKGNLSMSVNVGNGWVLGAQSLHVSNTGPHMATSRRVSLSGSSGTATTRQDNTRVGR